MAEGLSIMDNTGGRWYEVERYRLKGKVLVQEGDRPTAVAAEGSLLDALEVAP